MLAVYYSNVPLTVAPLIGLLSEADKQRAAVMTNERRKAVFITGRALLANALKQIKKSPEYSLNYNDLGKPLLDHPKGLHINISHSGEAVYVLLTSLSSCGIDAEMIKPRNINRVSEVAFSKALQEVIKLADNPLKQFYIHWTKKEARVKYAGQSIFSTERENKGLCYCSYEHDKSIFSICLDSDALLMCDFYHYDFQQQSVIPFSPRLLG